MISDKDLKKLKEGLDSSERPLFFFDDDCDGLTSYLIFKKYKGVGKGVIIKGKPIVEYRFSGKVIEYDADSVFILDKPMVEQSFLDNIPYSKYWLDHHEPQTNTNVNYFNPRIKNNEDNSPTSYWAYKTVNKYLWLAALGTVADWSLVLKDEIVKEYPDLLSKDVKTPDEALFNSNLGKLVKIINFNLKGSQKEISQSIKEFEKIETPYELLNNTSEASNHLIKKFDKINEKYVKLKNSVVNKDDKVLVHHYDDETSLTSDLANELSYENPDKIVVVGRVKNGKIMMSIRSQKLKIDDMVSSTAEQLGGYGGGHEHACGANIPFESLDVFVNKLKDL